MRAIYYTLVCLACILFVAGTVSLLGGIVFGFTNFNERGWAVFAGPMLGAIMFMTGGIFATIAGDLEP